MRLLAISGYSGSGKTTLITRLIPLLRAAGLRVAVIKHTHHAAEWDAPGKDSWRHREAGAEQVMLVTPERRFLSEACPAANELPLEAHVARLAPCDLVLAEGFKHHPAPRIEVIDVLQDKPRLYPADPQVLALAVDQPLDTALPQFARGDAAGISQFILYWFNHAELFERQ
jgi:molybdopterin-guanine dinucleotide biosynthesis protein B